MVLDAVNLHDVLQVDATVIAGLLILLTLLSFKPQKFQKIPEYVFSSEMTAEEKAKRAGEIGVNYTEARETERVETASRYLIATMTVVGISLFCASAIVIIFTGSVVYGKYAMCAGFIFLIIAIILLVGKYFKLMNTAEYFRAFSPAMKGLVIFISFRTYLMKKKERKNIKQHFE